MHDSTWIIRMPQAARWAGTPSIKGRNESTRMALLTFSLVGLQCVSPSLCLVSVGYSGLDVARHCLARACFWRPWIVVLCLWLTLGFP